MLTCLHGPMEEANRVEIRAHAETGLFGANIIEVKDMEAILLGFCAFSLVLSSAFVLFELFKDSRKSRHGIKPGQGKTQTDKKLKTSTNKVIELPAKKQQWNLQTQQKTALMESQSRSLLERLKRQLVAMGYVTHEQQMNFINYMLNGKRDNLNDINSDEMKHLFKTIRRYTGNEATSETTMAQPA